VPSGATTRPVIVAAWSSTASMPVTSVVPTGIRFGFHVDASLSYASPSSVLPAGGRNVIV
jgi:hypothetical protein